ncbi:MAG: hypothetical protein LUI39_05415 [Lachnospiraceae bacterium]|nr:hypothetical protein [Lachnospiraceae bacterium]
MNTESVTEYLESDRSDLLITGYYNPDEGKNVVRFVLKLHTYDEEWLDLGYLVCDIDAATLVTIMEKYVDVSQVCLWLQPLGDRAVAVTGDSSAEQVSMRKESRAIKLLRNGAACVHHLFQMMDNIGGQLWVKYY